MLKIVTILVCILNISLQQGTRNLVIQNFISFFDFDNYVGTQIQDSVSSNFGSIDNFDGSSNNQNSNSISGDANSALKLINSKITLSSSDFSMFDISSNNILISFYIHVESYGQCILSNGFNFQANDQKGYELQITKNGRLLWAEGDSNQRCDLQDSEFNCFVLSNQKLELNSWNHVIVYRQQNSIVEFYINGENNGVNDQYQITPINSIVYQTSQEKIIGESLSKQIFNENTKQFEEENQYFTGQLDEFYLFDIQLTETLKNELFLSHCSNIDNRKFDCTCQFGYQEDLSQICQIECDTVGLDIKISQDYLKIVIDFYTDFELVQTQELLKISEQEFSFEFCDYILESESINILGQNPQCKLNSEKQLEILLGKLPTISIGDQINLKDSKIILDSCQLNLNEFVDNYLNNSLKSNINNPLKPDIEMINPTSPVNICVEYVVCIFSSFNFGQQGFKTIVWELAETTDSQDTSEFEELLRNSENQGNFMIPHKTLNQNSTYKIKITYTNYYDVQGESELEIETSINVGLFNQVFSMNLLEFYAYNQAEFSGKILYFDCQTEQLMQISQLIGGYWKFYEEDGTEMQELYQEFEIPMMTQQVEKLYIEPYTFVPGKKYTIEIFTECLANRTRRHFARNTFKILKSEYQFQIQGGNRVGSYAQDLNVDLLFKDSNVKENEQPDIVLQWSCKDLVTGGQCLDKDGSPLSLDNRLQTQTYLKETLKIFDSYIFSVQGTVNSEILKDSVVITIVEAKLPDLSVSIPEYFLFNELNQNDVIQFSENQNNNENIEIICDIIYNQQNVARKTFKYKTFNFKLWDLFDLPFGRTNDITIKITLYDQLYLMPSSTYFDLKINFPPQNGRVVISPSSGTALETEFEISALDFQDSDEAMLYGYSIYLDPSQYQKEVELGQNPSNFQGNVLQNPLPFNTFKTILPQGRFNSNNVQEVLILFSIQDGSGAITNTTTTVQVSQVTDQDSILDKIKKQVESAMDLIIEPRAQRLNILALQINEFGLNGEQNNCWRNGVWNSETKKCDCKKDFDFLQDCSLNKQQYDKYKGVKLQAFMALNMIKGRIQDLFIQEQAIKSMNLLMIGNQIVNMMEEKQLTEIVLSMEQMAHNKNKLLQKTYSVQDTNWGNSQATAIMDSSNAFIGKQSRFCDEMLVNIEDRTSTETVTQNDYVFTLQRELSKTLQITQLPNSNDIDIFAKNLKQRVSKNTYKELLQNYLNVVSGINDFNDDDGESEAEGENTIEKNKVFKASYNFYTRNPLQQEKSFKYKNQKTQLFDMVITDDQDKKVDLKKSQKIVYDFDNVVSDSDEKINPVCIHKNEVKKTWNGGVCIIREKEGSNGYTCTCDNISPTTVVNDIEEIYSSDQLRNAFTASGFSKFIKFKFYSSVVFYTIIIQVIILAHLVKKGYKQDKMDKILYVKNEQNIVTESKKKNSKISRVHSEIIKKKNNEDENENENNNKSNNSDEKSKFSQHKLNHQNSQPSMSNSNKNHKQNDVVAEMLKDIDDQENVCNNNSSNGGGDISQRQYDSNRNFKSSEVQIQMERNPSQKLTELSQTSKDLERVKNFDRKDKQQLGSLVINDDYEAKAATSTDIESQENKQEELQKIQDVTPYIFYVHDSIGIVYNYDKKISRPTRYLCYFIKIFIILAISSIFSKEQTQYYALLSTMITAILAIIPVSVLTALLKRTNKILKGVGIFLYVAIFVLCFYLIIYFAGEMGEEKSNVWSFAYVTTFIVDLFFLQVTISFIKLKLLNGTIGKTDKFCVKLQKALLKDENLLRVYEKQQQQQYQQESQQLQYQQSDIVI